MVTPLGSSTDSKVRATLQNPIIHSGSERVKEDVNTRRQISLSPYKLGCRQQSLRIQIQGKSPTCKFEI